MRHFLEYDFRQLRLRFLLDDNDLLILIAILSDLPVPDGEVDSATPAGLSKRHCVPFPIDSPAINTWLYLITAETSGSKSKSFEFPGLPQVRSLLCQQLRTKSPNSNHATGQRHADGDEVGRVVVEVRLTDRPSLVALAVQQLAGHPLDDVVVFYVSLMISLQQVARACTEMQTPAAVDATTAAPDWLMGLHNKKHLFGLDSATENIIRRAVELVIDHDAPVNEREERALEFAQAAMLEEVKHGAKFPACGDFLKQILDRLVRLEELEDDFASSLQQEKIAALKQLAYGASHQINNPLGNIATRSQTLMRGETDPERRRQLAMIVSQAFRAHDMISDMMLFAHPPTLRPESVSLYDLACQAVGDLQAIADQQQTSIRLQCEADFTDLFADADHLVMLLKALCQNALEACRVRGQVTVAIDRCELDGKSFVRVDVSDDGPGLSEAARRHLFDPFYSGREAGRGLGLGLSKAWTIARLHMGKIEVCDGEDGGTKFSVFLPALAVATHAS